MVLHVSKRLLAGCLLCFAQVAAGRVMPLAGLLGLLDFGVVPEVEPFQIAARSMHLKIGRVAIVSGCDVVGDVAQLSVEGTVGSTAEFSLPHEGSLRH